jgi:cysteinyl-tRNA synthetase
MLLYNTLTQKKEEFMTHEPGLVKMYTCGPTVYHFAHIGNLRSYIMEDVLERYLKYSGYKVERVMNITDVGHLTSDADTGEDKMLSGARREHKSVLEIAKYYTDAFFADCSKLNIQKPATVIPATSQISEYIKIISKLMNTGYAYFSGGNIYFDTSALKEYYVFGSINSDDLNVGVREGVDADTNKRNKSDFVLWFTKSKFEDQELKWNSPWGYGYPGWHIECSAISMKYLGEYLDLHCGGIDNVFPHHTNEIAQSEAYLGHKWCTHWFHVMHLNVDSGKMSKSKGNFLTVSVLEERGFHPLSYRLFCLQSHYRNPLTFSFDSLSNAESTYLKLISRTSSIASDGDIDDSAVTLWKKRFTDTCGNDLNTSLSLTLVYDLLKTDLNGNTKREILKGYDSVLGLNLLEPLTESSNNDIPKELSDRINSLISERNEARKNKNWQLADSIRDQLSAMKVTIKDTPEGVTWSIGK